MGAVFPSGVAHAYAVVQTDLTIRPYDAPRTDADQMTAVTQSQIAFVFPGQGSQSLGMLADLAAAHPQILQTFAEASDGAGVDLWQLCQDEAGDRLNQTEFTQPALLAASVAVWRLWQSRGGAMPARLSGHSLGEYSALVAAGALSLTDGARLVRLRGQLMQAAAPAGVGAMAAVLGAEDSLVEAVCQEAAEGQVVVPANFNSPGQIVIGGDAAAVDRALALLAERGVRKAVKLAVSVPSHTPLMREAADQLAGAIASITWQMPQLPVVQNVDASAHDAVDTIADALVKQLYLPVQWTGCVQSLAQSGTGILLECGPGKVLSGLAKRIDKSLQAQTLGTLVDFDAALAAYPV